MKTLELSEIRGLQVKCSVCGQKEEFLVGNPNIWNVSVHPCPGHPPDKIKPDTGTVFQMVPREDVIAIAETIQAGKAGRFELTFLVKD
jgi:hypothetical protein